jgi:hypothetical protein
MFAAEVGDGLRVGFEKVDPAARAYFIEKHQIFPKNKKGKSDHAGRSRPDYRCRHRAGSFHPRGINSPQRQRWQHQSGCDISNHRKCEDGFPERQNRSGKADRVQFSEKAGVNHHNEERIVAGLDTKSAGKLTRPAGSPGRPSHWAWSSTATARLDAQSRHFSGRVGENIGDTNARYLRLSARSVRRTRDGDCSMHIMATRSASKRGKSVGRTQVATGRFRPCPTKLACFRGYRATVVADSWYQKNGAFWECRNYFTSSRS